MGVLEGVVGTSPAARRGRLLTLAAREPYLVALVGVYAFALARLAPFEFAGDSWLTLVGGREVWRHGLPAHETLTVMAHGARWIDQQWLAQLVFYGLYTLGGLKVVALGHVFALVGGLAFALFAARSLGASARAAFWVGIGSLFLAPWSLQLRAQSLAYVPFVSVLWLLARDARAPSRRVYLVLPVLVLWANLHGTVVLGALLVLLHAVTSRRWPLLIAPVGVLVSPYALDLVPYYRHLLVNPAFAHLVAEWRAPTFPGAAPFFVAAFVSVWLFARARSSLTLFEQLALLLMLVGGLEALRSIVWFALAGVVVLPRAVDAVWPPREGRPGVAVRWLARACALALPGVVVLLLVVPASAYEEQWPTGALAAVRGHPRERVLADDRYADWLLWNVPSLRGRLAYDVRFELLTTKQLRAIAGFRAQPLRLARGYSIVVLDGSAPPTLGGRTLYADGEITVLER